MQILFLLFVLLPAAVWADACVGKPDGQYEIGCRAYEVCVGGVGVQHNCPDPPAPNTVYNTNTKQCDQPRNVPKPCGEWRDCNLHQNHRYPDFDTNCTSYYTCFAETYFGHNWCSKGLVFDDSLQTCNWPANVRKPCGLLP